MSRLKVRCAQCGKSFVPAHAKLTLCPDCEKAQRAAKAQKRAQASAPAQARQHQAPLILGPGANVLRPGATSGDTVTEAAATSAPPPSSPTEDPPRAPDSPPAQAPQSPARAIESAGRNGAGRQRASKTSHVVATPLFVLSAGLRQRIEERYLALANPIEFDGIRTQIAAELGAPKPAVRAVVRELRARRGMPSWWELQGFAGSSGDLERIQAAYTPYLPLPPVGVHREIAASLGLGSRTVYRGIRKIRAQMGLAQYNTTHGRPDRATVVAVADAIDQTAS